LRSLLILGGSGARSTRNASVLLDPDAVKGKRHFAEPVNEAVLDKPRWNRGAADASLGRAELASGRHWEVGRCAWSTSETTTPSDRGRVTEVARVPGDCNASCDRRDCDNGNDGNGSLHAVSLRSRN
jgi:hypothetical protein